MKGEAVVVPAGSFSRYLGAVQKLLTYQRKGGLYVAKMKIRKRAAKEKKMMRRTKPRLLAGRAASDSERVPRPYGP